MPQQHPIWQLFHEDGSKYKNDRTHKNAWCLGCLLCTAAPSTALEPVPFEETAQTLMAEAAADDENNDEVDELPANPLIGMLPPAPVGAQSGSSSTRSCNTSRRTPTRRTQIRLEDLFNYPVPTATTTQTPGPSSTPSSTITRMCLMGMDLKCFGKGV